MWEDDKPPEVFEFDVDGWTVRLFWLAMKPQFEILGTNVVVHRTVDVHNAINDLIKGEEAMQKQPTPPAKDALKARADFLATHLTAIAHLREIERLREVECI